MYIILLLYVVTIVNCLDIRPYYDSSKGDDIVYNFLKQNDINKIIIAFVLGQDCIPNFNYIASKKIINKLNNIDKWISFGGANGPYIEQNCKNKTLLFNNLNNIIKDYNIKGIDFDIENNMLPNDYQHKNKITIGYTLPADEYGLNKQIGFPMLNITKKIFIPDYINSMAMFLRDRNNKKLNENIEKTIISVSKDINVIYNINEKETFKKMGVTVNIAGDDNDPFKIKNVKDLIKFSKNKNIYFISFWEIGKTEGINIYNKMIVNVN